MFLVWYKKVPLKNHAYKVNFTRVHDPCGCPKKAAGYDSLEGPIILYITSLSYIESTHFKDPYTTPAISFDIRNQITDSRECSN